MMKYTMISILLVMGAILAGCGDSTPKPAADTGTTAGATAAPMTPRRDPKTDPNVPQNIRDQMNGKVSRPGR